MKNWRTYDVTVSFAFDAMDEWHAMDMMEETLKNLEQHDQLPNWWIDGAELLVEPDEAYRSRIENGETAP